MKVLQVCPRYSPHTGGVETHVKEISERLGERGHEVAVHTADAGTNVERWEVRNAIEICRHRGFSPGEAFHIAPGIVSAVRQSDADVVHAHNYHSLPMFFAALGVTDERFVVTPHYHGESASGVRDLLLSMYRPLGKRTLSQTNEVIVVSEWERRKFREDFSVDSTLIPNGVEKERFADTEPEVRERPYILTVGRLEAYKGVQYVIRALTEMPEFDLLIAGSGPYREELERVVRTQGVETQVEFLGYVDEDRLPGLYAGAETFITLSEFEAYGMTVAEALVAGTPCVVLAHGALNEWVDQDGVVEATTTQPDDVASACRTARMVEQVSTIGVLDWSEVVDRLEAIYDE